MKNEITIDVARPAAAIFPYIEEPQKLPLWLSGFVTSQSTDVTPDPDHSTFRQVMDFGGRFLRMQGRVIERDPHRLLSLALTSGFADVRVDYRLEEGGGRTRLHYQCETGLHGIVRKAFSPLLYWWLQRKITRDLNRLKQVVEADA